MPTGRYKMLILLLPLLLGGCGNIPIKDGASPNITDCPKTAPPNEADNSSAFPSEADSAASKDLSAQIPSATQTTSPQASPEPPAEPKTDLPQAGLQSLENLIVTALEPVGSTMYVWGGGWNEADTGAGPEALSIGCSERWAEFAAAQDSTYNYQNHRYQIHDGLDCSGYMGWLLYNVFHTENSQSESDGYVMKSTTMSETLAGYGWGELIPASEVVKWKPGDICSMSGHVWLSLGTCRDGSVLLLHASPPGVRICGTLSQEGESTDAVALAEKWMSERYSDWYAKFPSCGVNYSYLETSALMRWNSDTFEDAEKFQALSAEEIVSCFLKK